MTDFATLVNPLQGSTSRFDFSTGNTYPAIGRPYGMNFWTPQTSESSWLYQYADHHFQGIRCTHQPSPWIGDYGHFTIMPVVGPLMTGARERASGFRHSEEIALPHYYQVHLRRYDAMVEITPTERAAVFRFRFPTTDEAAILIEPFAGVTSIHIDAANSRITGQTNANSGGVPENFACYFVAQIDRPVQSYGVFENGHIFEDQSSLKGLRSGAFVRLSTQADQPITMKVATSFISIEQAQRNLQQEIGPKDFESILSESHRVWNELLSHIQIDAPDQDRYRTFYSALYRTLLFPRQWHEYSEGGRHIHFSPYDGKVHEGVLYTDNGFWDTYRTVYPLLSLLFPQRLSEILNGWLNAYREGGWMPKWASPGYRDCMIGTHTDVIFADACMKDIPDVDWQLAYEAALKNATQTGMKTGHFGRLGLAEYLKLGYVPEDRVLHGASRTLDFAYNDFCVGQIATQVGQQEAAADLFARARNYRHVYDPTVGFMRGRLYDGSWVTPFSATCWGGPFVEGSAWQHLFGVPHDISGLINLLGGKSTFVDRLDKMMATKPKYEIGSYPYEIHEMTEMAAVDFGQYAHSNQPVHHVLYLYSYANASWKTQHWVRQVLNKLYTPDAFPGDEDNGEMAGWYVFSSLGLYPICPGKPVYTLGAPYFDEAIIKLPEDCALRIVARENSDDQPCIMQRLWNDRPLHEVEIEHRKLSAGGTMLCTLGTPSTR